MKFRRNQMSLIIAIIAAFAAVISAFAAVISAVSAALSWHYNREIFRPAPALRNTKIALEREEPNSFKINLSFTFSNVGKDKLIIHDIKVGYVNPDKKKFEEIGKKPVLNPVHAGCEFTYICSFSLKTKESFSDPEVFKKKFPEMVGQNALVLKLLYEDKSLFCSKTKTIKYFLMFRGLNLVLLSQKEYERTEEFLPDEFKVDK